MRPGTRGCADTKDPALLGCEEAALICSAGFYFRPNDQDWKIGEILPQRPGFLFGRRAAEAQPRVREALQD